MTLKELIVKLQAIEGYYPDSDPEMYLLIPPSESTRHVMKPIAEIELRRDHRFVSKMLNDKLVLVSE